MKTYRPAAASIDMLVIHAISLPAGEFGYQLPTGVSAIEALFTNTLDPSAHSDFAEIADLKVSAHLLVDRLGGVTQFVNLNERAWHAGQSNFCGQDNCNDFSIGIELEGCDDQPFTAIQYRVLGSLVDALKREYPAIVNDRIVGHSDIGPGRKTDPGPRFDWNLFWTSVSNEERV